MYKSCDDTSNNCHPVLDRERKEGGGDYNMKMCGPDVLDLLYVADEDSFILKLPLIIE